MMNFRKIAIKLGRLVVASQNLFELKCDISLHEVRYTTWVDHTLNPEVDKNSNFKDSKFQTLPILLVCSARTPFARLDYFSSGPNTKIYPTYDIKKTRCQEKKTPSQLRATLIFKCDCDLRVQVKLIAFMKLLSPFFQFSTLHFNTTKFFLGLTIVFSVLSSAARPVS